MKPTFFKSQAEFRKWLEKNHDQVPELWVGLQKSASSQQGLLYKQALDEALCFGWIDGVRKSIDESRWTIRFTPRKPRSIWSVVNIKRAAELKALGLMDGPVLGHERQEGRDAPEAARDPHRELGEGLEGSSVSHRVTMPQAMRPPASPAGSVL